MSAEVDYIEVPEAAEILGVSESQMRIYYRAGKLKTAKKVRGTKWLVSRKEIEGIADETIEINFSGAWGVVYGKDD
jgi:predicted site-specific integrase-resolvase